MRRSGLLIGATAIALLSACAAVEPVTDTAAEVVETITQIDPYEEMAVAVHEGEFATIQQFTTPGGASVWLVEEPSIPILSLRMAWETGSTSDPEGLEGLTNAMTYQMNEGAGDLDSQAFFKRMEELNMSFSCGSGNDATFCNASMLTENAADSFDMIALAYADPRFDEGPWERFVREQEVNLKTRETNARYLASRARIEALYPDHPYARQQTAESLAAMTAEAAKAHKDTIMVREGLLVTAVGAMSARELAPLIDKAIADLPEASETTSILPVELNAPVAEPIIKELPQPQSLVTFAAPAMTRENPDFYTAVVVNYTIGGGGFESRLMEDLRQAKGLTYGIGTGVSAGKYLQLWSGSGQTKNESTGEFIQGIKDNLTLIAEEGVTEEELADAKSFLTGSYPLGFDSNAKIAGNMMSVRLDDLPVDFFDTRNTLVEAVRLEDANRVAAEYLNPDRFTFVVVGQPEGLEPSVSEAE